MGREDELRRLSSSLDDALGGTGRVVLISGEPGIGKSRLAAELGARVVERGARVVWGRCWEAGGAPAYWPWTQSFRAYMQDQDPEMLRARFGRGAASMVQMLPEVAELPGVDPEPMAEDPEAARFRLFQAATEFLKAATAAEPLGIILDDLHVADASSLLFLHFLAKELYLMPMMVVGTYRDTDITVDHPLRETIAELSRLPGAERLELRGLSQAEVGRHIEALTDRRQQDRLVAAIHQATDGNPLFVEETVRLLASEGRLGDDVPPEEWRDLGLTIPEGVRAMIARRLQGLGERCGRILRLASVLGREFDIDVLKRVSGMDPETLLEALQEAIRSRLIGDVPGTIGRLRFSHALVRDAIYEEIPIDRRFALHAEVGGSLGAFHGEDTGPHLSEIAHHFLEAIPIVGIDQAVAWTRRAAEHATAQLAYEEGVRLYSGALRALGRRPADGTRCELLVGLGEAAAKAGDMPRAKEVFLEAAALAKRLNLPDLLARSALGYGGRFVWARAGTDPHLLPLLEETIGEIGDTDSALRARLLARLAGALRDQASREPRDTLSREAVEMARRIGDPATLAYTLDGRFCATFWPENPKTRLGIATELVQAAERAGNTERAIQGHHWRLIALLELGRLPEVWTELETKARLADEIRQPAYAWFVEVARAKLALFEGRLGEAADRISRALDLGGRAEGAQALLSFRLQTYALQKEVGSVDHLVDVIRRSVADYPGFPIFRCLLGLVYLESGRQAEGREAFELLARTDFASLHRDNMWLLGMAFLTEACEMLGDRTRASLLHDQLLPFAGLNVVAPSEVSYGAVSRYLGMLATVLGRFDEAARHFDAALEMNRRMGARPWVAHTQHDYARMLLLRDGRGDGDEAARLLEPALETARELGMTMLERRISEIPGHRRRRTETHADAGAEAVFLREGEYWTIRFGGDTVRVKDSKGLRYLAELLRRSGSEIHALELVAAGAGVASERAGAAEVADADLHVGGDHLSEGPDRTALRAYRRRLADLEAEIVEAEERRDRARASARREEQQFLAGELASTLGVGEGPRSVHAERARVAVTKAISRAIAKLGRQDGPLGRHLERSIRTGVFCSYAPEQSERVAWRL